MVPRYELPIFSDAGQWIVIEECQAGSRHCPPPPTTGDRRCLCVMMWLAQTSEETGGLQVDRLVGGQNKATTDSNSDAQHETKPSHTCGSRRSRRPVVCSSARRTLLKLRPPSGPAVKL
jgi:hypothetical protein